MPTKSFVTPGVQAPLQPDMASLAEERALLVKALLDKQGQTSAPLMDSGAFRTLNFDGLANALQARETQTALDNNRRKTLDVQGKYQQGLTESLQKFGRASRGGEVELLGPTPGGEPLTGRVPGDQRAWTKFLDSPYPEVRAAAERQKADYDKRGEKLIDRASLTSVQEAGDDWGQYKPKSEDKVVDNTLVRTVEGQKPILAPGAGYTQTKLSDGTTVNVNTLTGKQDSVSRAPSVNVNNMPGNEVLKSRTKKLEDSQESALKKADIIRSTEQALTALASGANSGFGVEYAQNLRTAITALTGKEFDATTPTAVLQKALAENVVSEFGGKLGTGVSNADVLFMGKATGDLATDAKAIERILAIRAAAAMQEIERHNRLVGTLSPYIDKTLGDGVTAELYPVERPQFGFKFTTPEAGAAFEAGITGGSYSDVLKRNGDGGKSAPAQGKVDPNSAESKAKLKAMGFPE